MSWLEPHHKYICNACFRFHCAPELDIQCQLDRCFCGDGNCQFCLNDQQNYARSGWYLEKVSKNKRSVSDFRADNLLIDVGIARYKVRSYDPATDFNPKHKDEFGWDWTLGKSPNLKRSRSVPNLIHSLIEKSEMNGWPFGIYKTIPLASSSSADTEYSSNAIFSGTAIPYVGNRSSVLYEGRPCFVTPNSSNPSLSDALKKKGCAGSDVDLDDASVIEYKFANFSKDWRHNCIDERSELTRPSVAHLLWKAELPDTLWKCYLADMKGFQINWLIHLRNKHLNERTREGIFHSQSVIDHLDREISELIPSFMSDHTRLRERVEAFSSDVPCMDKVFSDLKGLSELMIRRDIKEVRESL